VNFRLSRPFTSVEQEIADGIGDGLGYAEIGRDLSSGRISPHTVRVHVRNMATKIDSEAFTALAPRQLVYMFVKSQEWAQEHQTT
jgi:DNA-binding NarL/FixJ family response regulator